MALQSSSTLKQRKKARTTSKKYKTSKFETKVDAKIVGRKEGEKGKEREAYPQEYLAQEGIREGLKRTCVRWGLLFPLGMTFLLSHSAYTTMEQYNYDFNTTTVLLQMIAEFLCSLWTHVLWYAAIVFPVATLYLYCHDIGKNWLIPKSTAEACAIYLCWNAHLNSYTFFNTVFFICSFFDNMGFPTYMEIMKEYFLFVTFVPSPTCVLIASAKHLMRRYLKNCLDLDKIDHAVVCFCCTLPLAIGYILHRYYYGSEKLVGILINSLMWWLYFFGTYLGNPEGTGSRERDYMRSRFKQVWSLAHDYFQMEIFMDKGRTGSPVELIGYNSTAPKETRERGALFGFHPHGIIPYTAGLMRLHPQFYKLFPNAPIHLMTDSFTHSVPGMRDGNQMVVGGREVSREVVAKSLIEKEIVMLVPGGQREIFTSRSFSQKVVISRRHKGFIRMAMRHGSSLVPIFSMGEWMVLDNVYMPKAQQISRDLLGFPIPFIPYGSFLSIPRRTPIKIIFGEPFIFEKKVSENGHPYEPTEDDVNEAHRKYFQRIKEMFERNKARCGFPNHVLVFSDEL
eukprot:g9919.t1